MCVCFGRPPFNFSRLTFGCFEIVARKHLNPVTRTGVGAGKPYFAADVIIEHFIQPAVLMNVNLRIVGFNGFDYFRCIRS